MCIKHTLNQIADCLTHLVPGLRSNKGSVLVLGLGEVRDRLGKGSAVIVESREDLGAR